MVCAFVIPLLGLIPGIYLLAAAKSDDQLQGLHGWIVGAITLQLVYVVALLLIFVLFTPRHV
ncbi:hypothetical protein FC83_GL002779 [Agrilactobacillus composti DSM 18527 = JCM 14202]|uniref:DUF4190 domain-containing protein n=1 Tax=Agrilactobacillus composti DSM 18527 = JCM 14202 TaxID=1423734 RepID=X0QSB1_9LACO|nr:hypothetical protein FC83_GL002779 [Agrilactobacillus composti DSM 18527 = JCM 14202]GAF41465.1 hypothetical protein JCM14202_3406 [Agrilactobacillus composti DSM 18527 = JCM 14202]